MPAKAVRQPIQVAIAARGVAASRLPPLLSE
jgi:hypothetical protein